MRPIALKLFIHLAFNIFKTYLVTAKMDEYNIKYHHVRKNCIQCTLQEVLLQT